MNIQGVEILTQKIIYAPQLLGTILWLIAIMLGFFFFMILIEIKDNHLIIPFFICVILFIISMGCSTNHDNPTFLNKPFKIQYEIEITDNNAWKEIGPNYNVINKLYNNKEIYLIEGDYVE